MASGHILSKKQKGSETAEPPQESARGNALFRIKARKNKVSKSSETCRMGSETVEFLITL